MLNTNTHNFLQNIMCIDCSHLEQSIRQEPHVDIYKTFIEDSISLLRNSHDPLPAFEQAKAKLPENTLADQILDSLRHAFVMFHKDGLEGLWIFQERECWYPKVILNSQLNPCKINTLTNNITIYRGCDISEYNNKQYGQSWTTKQMIAYAFAYQHYQPHPWFNQQNRIILKADIDRADVYYVGSGPEDEIAVNPSKLNNVQTI